MFRGGAERRTRRIKEIHEDRLRESLRINPQARSLVPEPLGLIVRKFKGQLHGGIVASGRLTDELSCGLGDGALPAQ
jgi:hypothetical protein